MACNGFAGSFKSIGAERCPVNKKLALNEGPVLDAPSRSKAEIWGQKNLKFSSFCPHFSDFSVRATTTKSQQKACFSGLQSLA
jgi:hypothetical protein